MKRNSEILAWAGWQVTVPEDWRPLRIEGEWSKGSMIVGSADEAVMQVRWVRPKDGGFDAKKWRRKRLASMPCAATEDGIGPEGFPVAVLAPEYRTADGGEGILWFGYSPTARMTVEIVAGGKSSENTVRDVVKRVIPSLIVYGAGEATCWSVFGASFETPAGFIMTGKRLLLGDIAIEVSCARGRRLLVRQVYPCTLALARRKLPGWMDYQPFTEHRRFRSSGGEENWSVECSGRRLAGVRRSGRKRFPFPLGVIAPRWSSAAVVCDHELDRLLIAEYDSKDRNGSEVLSRAVSSMNWVRNER